MMVRAKDSDGKAGLTPAQWHDRLEQAAEDPAALAAELAELEREMKSERSWLHHNPSPDGLLRGLIDFFLDDKDDDYERLARKVRSELHREAQLTERFRSWTQGEDPRERLFPYLKDFGEKVHQDPTGLQFPGFIKYKGVKEGQAREAYVFYLNERFPGRDPANFHVEFRPDTGEVVLKRIYRMELPRIQGITTPARAVLAEMIRELAPDPAAIRQFEVDNAANIRTRQTLLESHEEGGIGVFEPRPGVDVAATPLGHLMEKLARELDLVPGEFTCHLLPFGMLRVELGIG